jgi:hypothetical protein
MRPPSFPNGPSNSAGRNGRPGCLGVQKNILPSWCRNPITALFLLR